LVGGIFICNPFSFGSGEDWTWDYGTVGEYIWVCGIFRGDIVNSSWTSCQRSCRKCHYDRSMVLEWLDGSLDIYNRYCKQAGSYTIADTTRNKTKHFLNWNAFG
jgi:hypothetical protein